MKDFINIISFQKNEQEHWESLKVSFRKEDVRLITELLEEDKEKNLFKTKIAGNYFSFRITQSYEEFMKLMEEGE
jgi:hypothetical protein